MSYLGSSNNLLSLTGLLVLAPLKATALQTALTGTSSWLNSLVLCPGQHNQHKSSNLSNGEFPACAAMTSDYVFRVENPATVLYLQRISETGKLTTLSVSNESDKPPAAPKSTHLAAALSILTMAFLAQAKDWHALSYLLTLTLIRLLNTLVIRRQARTGWHGLPEPGEKGDLLVLLSYDRWVRIRGQVDDLKAITSGRWLHAPNLLEESLTGLATCLAFLSPGLVTQATVEGQVVIVALLLCNAVLLGLGNWFVTELRMKGRVVRVEGQRKAYENRRVLARELIAESGRVDWALTMGLVPGSAVGMEREGRAGLVM